MRTRYGWWLLGLVIMVFVAGCEGRQKPVKLSEEKRTALEKEWELALPSDVTLLSSYASDRRNIETGRSEHYIWLIYSPSPIVLTPDTVPSPSGYIPDFELSTNTIGLFKDCAPKWDFGEPMADSLLRWSTDVSEFRGHLLKTSNGYYLRVECFEKKNVTTETASASGEAGLGD